MIMKGRSGCIIAMCMLIFSLSGCFLSHDPVVMDLDINHYKAAVYIGIGPVITYIARDYNSGQPGEWYYFHNSIREFDDLYQQGHRYSLRVRRETIPNPPSDTSMYNFELIEILTEETVGGDTTFELLLRDECNQCFVVKEGENYSLLGSIDIACNDQGLITELETLITTQDCVWKKGLFKHTFTGTAVELISIETCVSPCPPLISDW